jgi:hypothetical protein
MHTTDILRRHPASFLLLRVSTSLSLPTRPTYLKSCVLCCAVMCCAVLCCAVLRADPLAVRVCVLLGGVPFHHSWVLWVAAAVGHV